MNGLALLNCRESDLVVKTMNGLKEAGRTALSDYMDHFPHIAESLGGAKRILLAHDVGVRTHLREVSTAETIQMIRSMKGYMGNITAEIRPDHLFLNHENTKGLGHHAFQYSPEISIHLAKNPILAHKGCRRQEQTKWPQEQPHKNKPLRRLRLRKRNA